MKYNLRGGQDQNNDSDANSNGRNYLKKIKKNKTLKGKLVGTFGCEETEENVLYRRAESLKIQPRKIG